MLRAISLAALLTFTGALLVPSGAGAFPSRVGFNAHSAAHKRTDSDIDREVAAIRNLRGRVMRVDVSWAGIESARDVPAGTAEGYNPKPLAQLDRVVQAAHDQGIRVLVMVMGSPGWVSSCPRVLGICLGNAWQYPPRDAAKYGEFVRFLTDRYYPDLDGIEVWNEPNAGPSQLLGSIPDAQASYARMVVSASEQRTHGVPIYAGALQLGRPGDLLFDQRRMWRSWMRAIYPTIRGHYDVWAVHDYGHTPDFTAAQHEELVAQGDGDMPVSIDELGGPADSRSGKALSAQGPKITNFLAALCDARYSYVTEAMQYEVREDQSEVGGEANFGLLRADFSKKPGYDVVKQYLSGRRCG